ncbi:hypothetical protein [Actinomadura sp. 9N407]|uniref:hypothetical protein n=1 Tax=Actinomadura sp. 9N407 TaxID=3375154 RepID=UPI0037BDB7C1
MSKTSTKDSEPPVVPEPEPDDEATEPGVPEDQEDAGEADAAEESAEAEAEAEVDEPEADDPVTEGADKGDGTNTEASQDGAAKKPANRKRTVAMALTIVAAVCAAWFGWSWYGAAHDDSLSFSSERDEALRAGEQAVQNLNTLDYRSLAPGLKLWQDSSTSELYQQIVQGRPQFEQAVQKAKTITSAKVLDAAVTELDQHAGKASVIVALQITVTPPKGDPAIKKTRLVGQLTRTATGWKLSALAQAPVGATG